MSTDRLNPRPRWTRLRVTLLCLAIALAAIALWARGRGYKTWVLAKTFPGSKWALKKPSVVVTRPADRAGGVSPDAYIVADVNLPNPGKIIDARTLAGGVHLLRGNAREKVPAIVNTTGGGDAIILRPLQPLDLNASYRFEVLPALKDTAGAAFQHYTATFSTTAGTDYVEYPLAAEKVELPATAGQVYTGLTFGPDGRLYACTVDGRVQWFDVAADGTLSSPKTSAAILANNGGPRLVTGICFDPASTAEELILWATHGPFPFESGNVLDKYGRPRTRDDIADWSCKVSRLSGPDLSRYQDYVVGLPRAKNDHASNQPAFGPDGALYFAQASNTAMGAPDSAWGFRPERLLTAAVLRLDVKAVASPPLDVKTEDGGSYDPFAAGAPLTIFASGARNTYDLLFHSNGRLYGTLNGSARGGNAPGTPQGFASGVSFARRIDQDTAGPYTGPAVPEMHTLPTTNDYLLRFDKGRYYGHPNPARSEFVLNGGNPTRETDACEVPDYPAGTRPDRNWQAPAFDFGKNLAPCGLIEYRGDAFPLLRGKILVARYSGGKDLLALTPSSDGNVTEFVYGIEGFTHFHDPVDVAEDPRTGYLYVSELSGRKVTLLRPVPGGVSKRVIRQTVTPPGNPRSKSLANGYWDPSRATPRH